MVQQTASQAECPRRMLDCLAENNLRTVKWYADIIHALLNMLPMRAQMSR